MQKPGVSIIVILVPVMFLLSLLYAQEEPYRKGLQAYVKL